MSAPPWCSAMSLLFTSTPERARIFASLLAAELPDVPFHEATAPAPEDIRYLVTWKVPDNLEKTYPNLQVIFSIGAGVDQFDLASVPPDIKVIRMLEPGIREQMREYVAMAVLGLHRDLPDYMARQRHGVWKGGTNRPASDRRVGIMGLGQLGLAALDVLGPFGFQLAGWSRSEKKIPDVRTFTDLPAFLAETDILVCLLPLTDETRGILNANLFASLPAGAALVHVGRGPQLDQVALIEALEAEHLSAAWLDVTDPEPLPSDHPLWSHERVVITPHIASQTRALEGARHVVAGIRAHRNGLPLPGLVDRTRGY